MHKTLNSLDDDIILQYRDDQLNDKIMETQRDKGDIEDYEAY